MEPGKKARIIMHEMSALESGTPIYNIQQVKDILKALMDQTKKAAQLE